MVRFHDVLYTFASDVPEQEMMVRFHDVLYTFASDVPGLFYTLRSNDCNGYVLNIQQLSDKSR
jgi:hypothetical protein